ncbi:hypothetical protein EBR96_05525 [bacterium]|nr:hypothetical protein [bacterium]
MDLSLRIPTNREWGRPLFERRGRLSAIKFTKFLNSNDRGKEFEGEDGTRRQCYENNIVGGNKLLTMRWLMGPKRLPPALMQMLR